jgi:cold shock CspA family protein
MGDRQGRVRNYDPAKRYGFISGDDGLDYFFHLSDIQGGRSIARGRLVSFDAAMAEKGPRAKRVAACEEALRFDKFVMVRDPQVRGHEIVEVISEDCWYEDWDPNEAREGLKKHAAAMGANAIVDLWLDKYSKNTVPLVADLLMLLLSGRGNNYYQTMHRFHGRAVVIRRM